MPGLKYIPRVHSLNWLQGVSKHAALSLLRQQPAIVTTLLRSYLRSHQRRNGDAVELQVHHYLLTSSMTQRQRHCSIVKTEPTCKIESIGCEQQCNTTKSPPSCHLRTRRERMSGFQHTMPSSCTPNLPHLAWPMILPWKSTLAKSLGKIAA
jgi:hypothetical protein